MVQLIHTSSSRWHDRISNLIRLGNLPSIFDGNNFIKFEHLSTVMSSNLEKESGTMCWSCHINFKQFISLSSIFFKLQIATSLFFLSAYKLVEYLNVICFVSSFFFKCFFTSVRIGAFELNHL